mgnify:CR=1 FL=1
MAPTRSLRRIVYQTDAFAEETVARLVSNLEHILTNIAETEGNGLVQDIGLLSDAERRKLLEQWNDTEAGYPQERCIHALFEEQAERHPGVVGAQVGQAAGQGPGVAPRDRGLRRPGAAGGG